ncbi:hypothetical protein [Glycomyces salinus]|uniref:hypothetical protein n=1 Tax=Glycomyces salinus TaxID=980294 RepID=UPI0018ED1507|nr:hypothetical protein [Glycomyces salinus]
MNEPLDELDHTLVAKTVRLFGDPNSARERIRAIDDQILFKVKVQRWRGAVWVDASSQTPWLVAAGLREDGSADDFYEALVSRARDDRTRYNAKSNPPLTTDTHSIGLRPSRDDDDRWAAEAAVRLIRHIQSVLNDLVRASLLDGEEHTATLTGADAAVGMLVRADQGHETYVAVRITGSVPRELLAVVLARVPGCDRDGWYPETSMPTRVLASGEQVWSNLMDPSIAAALLDD